VLSKVLDSAPASKRIQGSLRLLGVRQMIPALVCASLLAISELQRAPLSMSADDSHGLKALTILGSHFLRACARAPLLGPDQLMKISMVSRIVVVSSGLFC